MRRVSLSVLSLVLIAVFGLVACKAKTGATLKLDKTEVKPGEVIAVSFAAPATYEANAWIGIIPSSIMHGNESVNDQHDLTYKYLNKNTSGQMLFNAPAAPGSYDFRMHDTDNNGKEVASVSFTVVGVAEPATSTKTAAAPTPTPTTTTTPAPTGGYDFSIGDAVLVEWHGSWWPARVIELKTDEATKKQTAWKIHYDGHTDSWDEWVGTDRIKSK